MQYIRMMIVCSMYVWENVEYYVPYSGKFWIGAKFRIFRMMPRRTKIKSTKSFTFEILITSNTRVLAKLAWHSRMRTYKNKNTEIYSEGLTAIYTKICTFQNFQLYNICDW